VTRGTTGAPRNTPGSDPGASASGGGTGTDQDSRGNEEQAARAQRPAGPNTEARSGGVGRLISIVCGRRSKYLVVAFWVLMVVVLGSLAGKLQGAEKNDSSAYLPSSAESTQELNEQNVFQSKNLNPALVVYVRPTGVTAADIRKADADAHYFASLPAVGGRVSAPVVSKDHKAIETYVGANLGYNADISAFVSNLKSTATKDSSGLSVYIGGPAASAADELKIFKGIDSTLLFATLAVVVVLLLLTYRSPVLWLLPIMSAGVALAVAEAVIYLLTQHANLVVNGQSGGILVVLVIGASTDYALLLIARYREELRRHADRHEAMAVALRRAGPAIIASGLTVVAGMLCLLAAESNDISGLGPVAAVGIAVGLIAMITLLPALLVICGRWMFWPSRPGYGTTEPTSRGLWSRVGQAISRRPRTVWLVTAILLAASAAGMLGFKVGTLTSAQAFRGTQPSITAQQVIAKYYPAGSGEPVEVISAAASAGPVKNALAATPGIASVSTPVTKDGLSFVQATMKPAPDSPAAYTLVDKIRSTLSTIPGAKAKVGGVTAINKDVEAASAHDRNLLIPLILGVVLIILALLLRAIVAPLILIGTVVLSFGAALGLSSLIFKHLFGFAGADNSVPLLVFVFLVALGIDYNIFLMTRVREESMRSGTRVIRKML
jgi:RND superfamily putative drug exporter